MHDLSDAELVDRAQYGNPEAVGLLYDRHHTRIFRYIRARIYDTHLAQDLTGEVFLQMVAHLADYQITAVAQIPVIAPHLDFRWSADGRRLAAPLRFGGAAVWGDVPNTDLLARFDAPLTDPALSPDGRFVALFNPERREISLYEVDSGVNVAMISDADFLPYGDPVLVQR
jgi:hypothetical protein